jgi:hypothetical protein
MGKMAVFRVYKGILTWLTGKWSGRALKVLKKV